MNKRFLFIFAALLAIAQGAWAQTAVDLGLPSGTKWADRNVGASSATGIGSFFEWGETTAFDNNYTYSDNPTTLPLSNDAARQTWGGQWRMPTKADFQELLNSEYTTWAWTENYNSSGVKGYIISGKGAYSGNSIFMPLTGYYNGSLTIQALQRGDYWSSTIAESDNSKAYWIGFGSSDHQLSSPYPRTYGFAVRPVQMFVGAGTEASPYEISTTTDWNNLVSAVNGGETYSGTYFKMTANISVTTWMFYGATTSRFCGTFDGGGYTLTVNYSGTAVDYSCAPFSKLDGATVKNLKVAGTITTSLERPASIAGYVSNGTITNCTSSVAITASKYGYIDGGGLVGCVDNSKTLTMSGCAFTGSITYSNAAGKGCGGMVGWMREGSTATLTDCVFAPSSVSIAKASDAEFNMFVRGAGSHTLTNCYYNGTAARNAKITKQDGGMQMRTIAKGDGVTTLTVNKGDGTEYTVSGITVYSGKGIDYNGTFYGGSGQSVGLTLGHDTRAGYQFRQYTASQGTLASPATDTPTITMPAANSTANDAVTVSAEYDPLYNTTFADGNDNTGWTIDPTQQIAGGTVTVSYSGVNKVKSVSVTNKYAIAHSLATSVVGDIVGSDGKAYSVAEKDKLPVGVTAEAVVCYKSGSNGLAVALVNLSGGTFDHTEAVDYTGSNYTGFCTAHPVSGQTWKVLSQDEFSNVYNGCGGTAPTAIYPADGYSGNRGSLDTYIIDAGGTAMSGNYWTATTYTGKENCFVCTNILSEKVCNFNYNNTTCNVVNVRYGFAF